jgi:hypothetical protein
MDRESSWSRAWTDAEHFRGSPIWFWIVEVIGGAMFGVVGWQVANWLTPQSASPSTHNLYSNGGGAVGIIAGFIIVFSLIFLWNLFRAPYRQRNEAWKQLQDIYKEVIQITYGRGIQLCRQLQDGEELYRVAIGIKGKRAVDNLEVRPFDLRQKSKKGAIQIPIAEAPLTPMVERSANPGSTTCYVNLLKHKTSSHEISLCYRDIPNESLTLKQGEYLLQLAASGKEGEVGFGALVINVSNNRFEVKEAPHNYLEVWS